MTENKPTVTSGPHYLHTFFNDKICSKLGILRETRPNQRMGEKCWTIHWRHGTEEREERRKREGREQERERGGGGELVIEGVG